MIKRQSPRSVYGMAVVIKGWACSKCGHFNVWKPRKVTCEACGHKAV